MLKAFVTGVAGTALSEAERSFIAEQRPAGLILFARNLASHDQIRALVRDFRATVGTDQILVLIDQEGGRVQRLRPPLGSALPPAAAYAAHFDRDIAAAASAARLVARLLADELRALGIDTDCAPLLDVPIPEAHSIIGDRAFGTDSASVIALGRAFAEGLMEGAVLPVMKHIPGHGRALSDSHLGLPVVEAPRDTLAAIDFAPFKALAGLPAAMTAHVVFTALDASQPATTSRHVIREIVRGHCGFDGLLFSDDLGMRALSGSPASRARAVIEAGVDVVLHCSGLLDEMREVASAVPELDADARRRFEAAIAVTHRAPAPYDASAARAALDRLVARAA